MNYSYGKFIHIYIYIGFIIIVCALVIIYPSLFLGPTKVKIKGCSYCGSINHLNHEDYIPGSDLRLLMEENHICFKCAFWKEKVQDYPKNNPIIIKGVHHMGILTEFDEDKLFPAGWYTIRKLDSGEIYKTPRLTYQGEIPEHFKTQLPDNAEFIKNTHSVYVIYYDNCFACKIFSGQLIECINHLLYRYKTENLDSHYYYIRAN
jgi:hypothetical protein